MKIEFKKRTREKKKRNAFLHLHKKKKDQRQQVNVQCNKLVAHSFVKFWVTNDYVKDIL